MVQPMTVFTAKNIIQIQTLFLMIHYLPALEMHNVCYIQNRDKQFLVKSPDNYKFDYLAYYRRAVVWKC